MRCCQHRRVGRCRIGDQDVDLLQAQLQLDARTQLDAQSPAVSAGLHQFDQQIDVATTQPGRVREPNSKTRAPAARPLRLWSAA
jgi:hypothetical protein